MFDDWVILLVGEVLAVLLPGIELAAVCGLVGSPDEVSREEMVLVELVFVVLQEDNSQAELMIPANIKLWRMNSRRVIVKRGSMNFFIMFYLNNCHNYSLSK